MEDLEEKADRKVKKEIPKAIVVLEEEHKHITPCKRRKSIRRLAYNYSLNNPNNSELHNWLEAEKVINAKYPK
jgi:hypothetical protein